MTDKERKDRARYEVLKLKNFNTGLSFDELIEFQRVKKRLKNAGFAIVILFFTFTASAQVTTRNIWFAKDPMYHESIYFKPDTMTVKEAFDYLKLLTRGPLWYMNRYVIKGDTLYLRYGISLRPNRTYIMKTKFRKKHVKL